MIKLIDTRKETVSLTERNIVFTQYDSKRRLYQTIAHRFKTTGQAEYFDGSITKLYDLIK